MTIAKLQKGKNTSVLLNFHSSNCFPDRHWSEVNGVLVPSAEKFDQKLKNTRRRGRIV